MLDDNESQHQDAEDQHQTEAGAAPVELASSSKDSQAPVQKDAAMLNPICETHEVHQLMCLLHKAGSNNGGP